MTTFSMLATKLHIPGRRPGLVSRPRLLRRLDEGLQQGRKLALVSAPAGSGKTTLLSEWVTGLPSPPAWVTLDEDDNDEVRFWAYLFASLQTVGIGLDQESQQALQSTQLPPLASNLTLMLNELTAHAGSIVLILDDYHVITAAAIHQSLSYLLEHQPPQLHLVLVTRADPPLPLSRLRARAELTELRVDDLRFSHEETAVFLNDRMGLSLQPADVADLESRTEGWIAGLHLAALALHGKRSSQADISARQFIDSFTDSHHYILEYLTEEVLYQQPESVQRFLVTTSILDRLCASLCNAVQLGSAETAAGLPASASHEERTGDAMLAHLHRANLFLAPLDDQHVWYRYHPLFAGLLLKRLRQYQTREEISDLYARASAWHENHGSLDEAVKYALRAEDFQRVVRLVEDAASAGQLENRLTTLLRWLDAVPDELLLLRPRLCIYQAWALVINEQIEIAIRRLRQASQALESLPPSPEYDAARNDLSTLLALVEMMAAALAAAYAGEDMEQVFQTALTVREQALAAGNLFLAGHATNGLAMARYHQARLTEAAEHYRELVDLGVDGEASQRPLVSVGYIGLASICLERNELDAAEGHLDQGLRLGGAWLGSNVRVSAAIAKSRLAQYSGDAEEAFRALDEAERLERIQASGPARQRLDRQRARLALYLGNLDEAARQIQHLDDLSRRGEFGGRLPPSLQEARQILQARFHLHLRDPEGTLACLEPLQAPAETAGRLRRLLEIHLLKALAHHAQRNPVAAIDCLQRSLALAEPDGALRIYLDEGPAVVALFTQFCASSRPPSDLRSYGQRVLESFADRSDLPAEPETSRSAPRLVEPLTRREHQVLRLLVAGLSGPEIAEELVVAPSTVRSHIKAIYGKLDVHSRYEAMDRARTLGLV